MTLHVLGVSHRTATPEARSAAALTPDRVRALLATAAAREPGLEVAVLATCNRTEFHLAGVDALGRWSRLLADLCPAAPGSGPGWYDLTGDDAVRHVLRVACGLDSQLLGDAQITGQLRTALSLAQDAGTLGGTLSPLLATALRTGRTARATTDIGIGSPGIGPACAEAVVARAATDGVLVLGTGDAARLVLRSLRASQVRRLAVAGRRDPAARAVAADLDVDALAWDAVPDALTRVSSVVVATGAAVPVLVEVPARAGHLVVVDAGFPAQVGDVARPGVEVVPLQALTSAADDAARRRRAAVPEVELLVERALSDWRQDRADRATRALLRGVAA